MTANNPSIAQAVLAEAQAQHATPAETPAQSVAPEPVEVLEAVEPEATPSRRNLSWDDAVKQVPPDIAKLMTDFRKDYTKKTQKISAERSSWTQEREALMAGLAGLKEVAAPEGDYDPFNEESMQARIESEVNRRLKSVLEPMKRKVATMKAEEGYQGFLSANPDFKNDSALRNDVQAMLEKAPSLDLETAYYAAKGRRAKTAKVEDSNHRVARRNAEREAAMKGTAATRRPPSSRRPQKADLKKMSAVEIYRLAESMQSDK